MTGPARDVLRELLTDGLGGRRFTQPSPVLPDVWLAYGRAPDEPQEILLTPARNGQAEVIAARLRSAVAALRGPEKGVRRQPAKKGRAAPAIASIPELVAARLYFDELVALVLPATRWFGDIVGRSAAGLAAADGTGAKLGAAIDELESRRVRGPSSADARAFHPDFVWLAAVIGTVRTGSAAALKPGAELARAFVETFGAALPAAGAGDVFRVSLNRPVQAACLETALAIKADAARLLFNISCANITWAVVDSGIDRTHPAFRDWSKDDPAAHRVDRTYDFTRTRDLLDPATAARLLRAGDDELTPEEETFRGRLRANLEARGAGDPDRDGPRHVAQLRDRLELGLSIDWGLLEPFLHVVDPPPPPDGHGTQVAGILGADWREDGDDGLAGNGTAAPGGNGHAARNGNAHDAKKIMVGICPDIRLVDIRVLDAEGRVREFDVIAALQFIGHLNRRADGQLVHGANLSLEIEHRVENYACGSTPVCEACNALAASGVVLVAAAGNNGHQRYSLASGRELGGYHAISITDPGNADGVITVGATHRNAHRYGVSYFSSRGPTGDGRRKPDLVAPGEGVRGPTLHGAETVSNGTSFAAPHASGAAALLMARFGELRGRPQRIKDILCGTATDLGREPYFQGAGMIDILRALQSI